MPRYILRCGAFGWDRKISRCPSPIQNLTVTDVKCTSSSSKQLYSYKNIKVKKQNFTSLYSDVFKNVKLVLNQTGTFRWKFKLSRPVVKFVVRTEFLIHKFQNLSSHIRDRIRINITYMNISFYRKCKIIQNEEYAKKYSKQIRVIVHICDTLSEEDAIREAHLPPDELTMTTVLNKNVTIELRSLLFGQFQNNFTRPLCGKPPVGIGEILNKTSISQKYEIKCESNKWSTTLFSSENAVHFRECNQDGFWNGSNPICVPKKSCSLDHIPLRKNQFKNISNQQKISSAERNSLFVQTFQYFYRHSKDIHYAIIDSEIVYACDSSEYSLVGDKTRKCLPNSTWSGQEPRCESKFFFVSKFL